MPSPRPTPLSDEVLEDCLQAVHRLEEPGPLGGVVPKLVAEDPKGPGGIAEAAGDLAGREALHKEAAQGLVLALGGRVGGEEEAGLGGGC